MRHLPNRGRRIGRSAPARLLSVLATVFALVLASGVTGGAVANAWSPTHGPLVDAYVPSSMGNIKVQIQTHPGASHYLLLLDGLRARNDFNGWDIETNAFQKFQNDNINVVMPVGGAASFYTDWERPNSFAPTGHYMWETFLTQNLPDYLAGHFGMARNGNAIAGLSMGGSAALDLAAHHKPMFAFAASFSGYLNNSAPGMPEAMGLAMASQPPGYNILDMWGPPWDPNYLRNDPFVFAPQLRGLSLYISAASGIPTNVNNGLVNTVNGAGLEALALANTRAFQLRLESLGIPATYSFPATGIHAWDNWSAELSNARPQILAAVGA